MSVVRRQSGHQDTLPPDMHPVLRRVLVARGVRNTDDIDYGLDGLLPPGNLSGLDDAANLLAGHIESGGRILVIGDFDADGATSVAVAVRGLRALGAHNVGYLVPNRFEFGYGLTPEIVELALQESPALLITVDNGIASHDGVHKARQAGVDVLVTDHHLPGKSLPAANAIVNPNCDGDGFESKALAGVGVIFYTLLALRAELRARGSFTSSALPNLANLLPFVALGTVADVVQLDRNNRILIEQGLRRVRAGDCSPGMLELLNVAGRARSSLTATDFAFGVAPRINAAGRMDDIAVGVECLLADEHTRARKLAVQLDAFNQQRREVELEMRVQANAMVADMHFENDVHLPPALVLHDPDWHQGVVGLLASRIKEATARPVVVFADQDDATVKGSGRSIPGFHLRDALDEVATRYPEILEKFGGHAMAAGLTIERQHLAAFTNAFQQVARRQLGELPTEQVVFSDGELEPADFTLELAGMLRDAGPWGQGFPEPLFDNRFEVVDWKVLGGKHLKLTLSPHGSTRRVAAIAFNVDSTADPGRRIDAVYRLAVNEYQGSREAQLVIEHFAPVAS